MKDESYASETGRVLAACHVADANSAPVLWYIMSIRAVEERCICMRDQRCEGTASGQQESWARLGPGGGCGDQGVGWVARAWHEVRSAREVATQRCSERVSSTDWNVLLMQRALTP